MGIISKVFGSPKDEQKVKERERYDDMLKKGMKPSEAIATLDRERIDQKTAAPPAQDDRYRKIWSAPKQRKPPKQKGSTLKENVKTLIKFGHASAENIKKSGFLGGGGGSILRDSPKGGDSFLDFSRVRNESIFGGGEQKEKKHKKQQGKGQKKSGRQIVINVR